MLDKRIAIVYGGGGLVGRAVSCALARHGAAVHLVGRTPGPLEASQREIEEAGGTAHVALVDALDEDAVEAHATEVATHHGGLDVAFNALTYEDIQGTPLLDLPTAELAGPLSTAVRSQLITTRAVARRMIEKGSGVILTVVGHGPPHPGMGSTAITWQLVESLTRQWAVELGPRGIRVNWLRIAGTTEGIVDAPERETSFAVDSSTHELLEQLEESTMLRRLPGVRDVGELAAFLASDRAGALTASGVNVTAGMVSD